MTPYDPFEIMSYETFLLTQYQVNSQGLYYYQGRYFICCPEINQDTLALDGSNVHQWFRMHKIMSTNLVLVNQLPEGAIKIDDQLADSVPLDSGYLVTNADIEYECDLLIPKLFPDYKVVIAHPTKIVFGEEVSEEGFAELRRIFADAKFQVPIVFENDTALVLPGKPRINFFQTILTYRQSKSTLSPAIAAAWEADEDTWLTVRNQVMSENPGDKNPFKPASFDGDSLRCLIDCSYGTPDNIRNYLTMYEQVCIVAPIAKMQEQALSNLGISPDELKELVKLNKVQLLLPKSIEHYEQSLLQDLLDIRKDNLHFTRSVSTMTIMEMRKRNPFLFPAIPIEEKQALLHAVDQSTASSVADEQLRQLIRSTISDTGNAWVRYPNWINQLDSAMLSRFGTANLIRSMLEFHTKKDFKAVFDLSAPAVEWEAATGSILIPATIEGYDTAPISGLVADVYSGTPSEDWVLQDRSIANFTAENILTISQYLPVLELATTFNGAEISRFRKLVLDITRHQQTQEGLQETIEAYNHFVKQYEKNKDNLASWNIKGFVLGLIGKGITGVPMPSWLLGHVLKQTMKFGGKDPRLAKTIETIEANLQGSIPDAVMISKMRDKVKKKL